MNDLFVCDICNTVDALEFAYPHSTPEGQYQCTLCQTGTWHGLLTQRPYDPTKDIVVNRANGIGLG